MPLSLSEILAEHWADYARANRKHLAASHYRAVRRVLACRTLQTIRLHLGADPKPAPKLPEAKPHTCPCCGGKLTFLRDIAPIHLLRAPPRRASSQVA